MKYYLKLLVVIVSLFIFLISLIFLYLRINKIDIYSGGEIKTDLHIRTSKHLMDSISKALGLYYLKNQKMLQDENKYYFDNISEFVNIDIDWFSISRDSISRNNDTIPLIIGPKENIKKMKNLYFSDDIRYRIIDSNHYELFNKFIKKIYVLRHNKWVEDIK